METLALSPQSCNHALVPLFFSSLSFYICSPPYMYGGPSRANAQISVTEAGLTCARAAFAVAALPRAIEKRLARADGGVGFVFLRIEMVPHCVSAGSTRFLDEV